MKNIAFTIILFILAIPGFSGPDTSAYYAASRLDYYTNEEAGELMVFVPERLKGMKITIDLVFEYQNLTRGFVAFTGGVTAVPFPMKLLKAGKNEITVSFNENEKWVDSRKVWVEIRPYKENAVKIDRATGGLVTEGLPFFPFGYTASFPVDLGSVDNEVVKGFNQVSPHQDLERKSLKERKAYMNRLADLGIRVNYNLGSLFADCNDGISSTDKLESLRKEVELFRDHPALLAWCIAENPDMNGILPDSLRNAYNLIKELDPYHPVSLLIGSPRNAARYIDVMDIVMTSSNPFPQGSLREVKDFVRISRDAFWLQKPTWVVPQTFGGSQWWQREPTAKEVRAMTYMAVIYGATGVQYPNYGPARSPKSSAMWDECGAMALEFAELTPEFLSTHPAPALVPDNPSIHAKAWNRAGLVTIAVVNDQNEPRQFKLKMKDVDITILADVMFENRKIEIRDGMVEDIIDGFGVRVYRFDARLTPDWMKDLQPGNLAIDPGFEDMSNAGVPSACSISAGADPGNTFFTDTRRHYQGEHTLRLNNPSEATGDKLSFYGLTLSEKKSYTVSIVAKTGPSSNLPAGKKEKAVRFTFGLGEMEKTFTCTDSWQTYQINALRSKGEERVSPWLELAGKGTAWFDNLQVYPDMELSSGRGEDGKSSLIEIKSNHPGVQIFYTIDGMEPTIGSLPYMIPVEVTKDVLLKAAAYKDGIRVGYIEGTGTF
jgi:hypothetical protein